MEPKKKSRRAQRRRKQEGKSSESGTKKSSSPEKTLAKRDPETNESVADEGESEASSSEDEASDPAKIRDRNKRLRAKAAAQRRKKRARERNKAVAQGLDTSEMVDDALARGGDATIKWAKKNSTLLQWTVILVILAGVGWQVYSWRQSRAIETASDQLYAGYEAEYGLVGVKQEPPSEDGFVDPRPRFASDTQRLKAAEDEYKKASSDKRQGPATLAKMGLAGIRYEQGKYKEAKKLYSEVRDSKLSKTDTDLRMRAVEGVGLSSEALKDLSGAEKAFRELENSDEPGFSALGLYHQARLAHVGGNKDKAKKLIAKVKKKIKDNKTTFLAAGYLEGKTQALLAEIDPSQAQASAAGGLDPAALDALRAKVGTDPDKVMDLIKDMQKNVKDLTAPLNSGSPANSAKP